MRGSELLLAGNVQEKAGSPFGKKGMEGDGRLVRYFLPGDCTILRKTGKLGAWRMIPPGRPTWERRVPALPRQPCSSPRTAAAPLTTGGSGQGYRDLKAESRVGSSERPDGDCWGSGSDSLTKPDTGKSASPARSPRIHTPPHTQMETERQMLWSWAEL